MRTVVQALIVTSALLAGVVGATGVVPEPTLVASLSAGLLTMGLLRSAYQLRRATTR